MRLNLNKKKRDSIELLTQPSAYDSSDLTATRWTTVANLWKSLIPVLMQRA